MSIVKLNNRSVKDVTAFGSISSLGSLTHIATQTASSSASISFTSGINSTYKEYIFYFVNIHPATNGVDFHFNGSIDGGSNYNVVKTTTFFNASHYESDLSTEFAYKTGDDLAQSTSYQSLTRTNLGNDNDQSFSGMMHLFNPSSTTFVKHFMAVDNHSHGTDLSLNDYVAGYFNTTSAINSMDFKMSSGNIDSGQILLFGLN